MVDFLLCGAFLVWKFFRFLHHCMMKISIFTLYLKPGSTLTLCSVWLGEVFFQIDTQVFIELRNGLDKLLHSYHHEKKYDWANVTSKSEFCGK